MSDGDQGKEKLTPEQHRVMREGGTEPPFSGRYVQEKARGMYKCAACGRPLFSSETKFDSGTGWPSFDEALPLAVRYEPDNSHGLHRTEVLCAGCGSHLGHVFDDPPRAGRSGGPPSTKRYCINSVCLDLEKDKRNQ